VVSHAPNSTVTLDVVRNNKPIKVEVKLGERPNALDWTKKGGDRDQSGDEQGQSDNGSNVTVRGISVENLSPELAQQLQAPSTVHGVVVDDIDQSSPAAGAGAIGKGTIITAVERHPVPNVGEFKRLMNENQNKAVLLTVVNGGQTQFTVVPAK